MNMVKLRMSMLSPLKDGSSVCLAPPVSKYFFRAPLSAVWRTSRRWSMADQ